MSKEKKEKREKINPAILKTFGKNIKQERLLKGLTQEQLAEKINTSSHFISLVERGETSISFLTLINLCNALYIDANTVLKNIIPTNNTNQNFILNSAINAFEEKDKAMIRYLVDYIADTKNYTKNKKEISL